MLPLLTLPGSTPSPALGTPAVPAPAGLETAFAALLGGHSAPGGAPLRTFDLASPAGQLPSATAIEVWELPLPAKGSLLVAGPMLGRLDAPSAAALDAMAAAVDAATAAAIPQSTGVAASFMAEPPASVPGADPESPLIVGDGEIVAATPTVVVALADPALTHATTVPVGDTGELAAIEPGTVAVDTDAGTVDDGGLTPALAVAAAAGLDRTNAETPAQARPNPVTRPAGPVQPAAAPAPASFDVPPPATATVTAPGTGEATGTTGLPQQPAAMKPAAPTGERIAAEAPPLPAAGPAASPAPAAPSVAPATPPAGTPLAATPPAPAPTEPPAPPVRTTVADLSIHLGRAVLGRQPTIHVQLQPASLGRLDITLDFQGEDAVRVVVRADRPEAIEQLARHGYQLERALQQAGLDLGRDGIRFDLNPQTPDGTPQQRRWGGFDRSTDGARTTGEPEMSDHHPDHGDPSRLLDLNA